ncbi:MAG: permease [Candidatus Promineifilaceae bacterium]
MASTEGLKTTTIEVRGEVKKIKSGRLLVGLGLIVAVALIVPRLSELPISGSFETFVTIFLGIFIEAVPFLLAGSAVSGLIEVFIDKNSLARVIPKRPLPAALIGSVLGFAFPVCECGVVPVTRRLYQKGLPLPVGVAFLLAAPVVNPVVILSTYAAFGFGPVLIGRVVFSVLIAFAVGLLFSVAKPEDVLLPETLEQIRQEQFEQERPKKKNGPLPKRIWEALAIGADDFLDMARYLIVGSLLAAGMQTLVPQSTLLSLGTGPVISVLVMILLAFVLSICSTVDAFVALSFSNSFTTGSILAFLVFGPMVDIKSSLMFMGVFKRRVVAYLIILPLLFALVISVFINLNVGW